MAKILHLIGKFDEDGGGAQRVILDIINTSKNPQLQMGVCSIFGNASLSKRLASNVFNVNLNYRNRYNPKIYIDLYKIITKWKPDILHIHSSVAGVFGRPIARILGVKLISTVHNDVKSTPNRNKIIDKLTLGFSDSIVCVSEIVEESVEEVIGPSVLKNSHMKVISNCLDCSEFRRKVQSDTIKKISDLGLNEASHIVGSVGRLHSAKGHKYLIKAWADVANIYPDAILLIIGDGEEKKALQDLVLYYRLSKSIYFLGARNDVPDLLNIMDIFVFPSNYEGLPIALLEAMCMEKIIIASDIRPLNKILGNAGLLVPPRDPGQLSQNLIEAITNLDAHRKLGKIAKRRLLENFSPKKFGQKYLSVYKKYI